MDWTIPLYVIAAVLILLGLLGTVLPALPGIPLMFAGMVLVAFVGDFQWLGPMVLVVLGLLTVLAVAIDFAASLLGAQRVGASKLAIVGAALGTLVGFFLGLPGLILGPFIGAFVGEFINGRHAGTATKVGLGTWLGMVIGGIAKIAIAFVMLGVFALGLAF
jgi:uncharacterized protein YqgC (DUF456 family)